MYDNMYVLLQQHAILILQEPAWKVSAAQSSVLTKYEPFPSHGRPFRSLFMQKRNTFHGPNLTRKPSKTSEAQLSGRGTFLWRFVSPS